jgi:hypothetical protein
MALVLEFDRRETERGHRLEVLIVGEDGEEVARVDAEVRVGNPAQAKPAENVHVPIAVDLRGVPLERPGAYELRVYVDDEHRRTLQLWAELLGGTDTIDL